MNGDVSFLGLPQFVIFLYPPCCGPKGHPF